MGTSLSVAGQVVQVRRCIGRAAVTQPSQTEERKPASLASKRSYWCADREFVHRTLSYPLSLAARPLKMSPMIREANSEVKGRGDDIHLTL
jgi:hypothetical protein